MRIRKKKISFDVYDKPPKKSQWGKEDAKLIIKLREAALKARNNAGIEKYHPRNMIDYVIIHELCHLKIKDHSFRYWNLVRKCMSNYQENIAWLEVNSKYILFA